MSNPVFVLGADDPEMKAIREILEATNQAFGFAAVGGSRCHPGNAYAATGLLKEATGTYQAFDSNYQQYVFVECRPAGVPLSKKRLLTFIDHHEEGDPGYSLGPSEFWKASSLGQTVRLLQEFGHRVAVTHKMKILAAMDHCRPAAMFGKCPGVRGKEVLKLRVQEIAAGHKVSESKVRTEVRKFSQILKERATLPFGDGKVVDLTDIHLGSGYSLELLCAQTALDVAGLAGLLRHRDRADAPSTEKISISGHVTPKMVKHFTHQFASTRGLVRLYGVPARGFAGGYLA